MNLTGRLKRSIDNSVPPAVFLIGLGAGLWLPDTDLIALSILHHRSIITHSILIPWLLSKVAGDRISHMTVAGLYVGVAIHLAADSLSATVGFGMVWLPWPIKTPLGLASPIWLFANAAAGVWFMLRLAPNYRTWAIVSAACIASSYALLNEMAFAPFVVFGIVLFIASYRRMRQDRK